MRQPLTIFLLLLSATAYCQPQVIVLGVAQDGGYPHIGCSKSCCQNAWNDELARRHVVSLALVDPENRKWYLFEATPDINEQLRLFSELTNHEFNYLPDGIFLTHAHIGHYTGLMEFGREAMGTKDLPVHVLPKMKSFLESNGPWSQLVSLKNIKLIEMQADVPVDLGGQMMVLPFIAPHRDEYSETAGFKIISPQKKYLFIPDIDKWSKFKKDIVNEVGLVDVAFLDASFYSADELPNRDLREIPHPLVTETMKLFKSASLKTKSKVHFIHFNHSNPLLSDAVVQESVTIEGFNIAEQGKGY